MPRRLTPTQWNRDPRQQRGFNAFNTVARTTTSCKRALKKPGAYRDLGFQEEIDGYRMGRVASNWIIDLAVHWDHSMTINDQDISPSMASGALQHLLVGYIPSEYEFNMPHEIAASYCRLPISERRTSALECLRLPAVIDEVDHLRTWSPLWIFQHMVVERLIEEWDGGIAA